MSAHAVTEYDLVRASFAREKQRMGAAERRGELVVGTAFIVSASALALIAGIHGRFPLVLTALYVLGLAVAGHVRFDVGAGFTVPTQLVFVPMLFALPVAATPLLVPLSLALGMVPAVLRGHVPASRLVCTPGNSWFAFGPALVLVLAGSHLADATPLELALALLAQFSCDFVANAVRERLSGGIEIRVLAAETRWIYLVDAALAPIGLAVAFATLHDRWSVLLIAPLFGLLRVFSRERRARLEQLVELNDAYRGTALVLGDVVEADDTYTGEHCRGVVRLALDVAGQLGLDAHQRRNVEFGALLHDVGKIAVPKEIINKPGRLDEREWAVIMTHTIEGQRMLDRVGGIMHEVGLVVRSSHESWDGSGYPDGLRGETIPLESRIVAACDAFNAMTTTRPYRKAMTTDDAVGELVGHAGVQFDPQVVQALIRTVDR
jgi:HD-GYP domain-containing protein (c-di-GMP phosphodiesterase class II)